MVRGAAFDREHPSDLGLLPGTGGQAVHSLRGHPDYSTVAHPFGSQKHRGGVHRAVMPRKSHSVTGHNHRSTTLLRIRLQLS